MTFVLKDLAELRLIFDDKVEAIKKRDKKGDIKNLSEPKRSELLFLTAVLERLEAELSDKAAKSNKPSPQLQASIFVGAMLVVMQDNENNRGFMDSEGLLSKSIADVIGIGAKVKAEDKPSLLQNAKFFTVLNTFLNQVYVEGDSRKGFLKSHILDAVPTDQLSQLIKIGYKKEKEAQKAVVASFSTDGKSTLDSAAAYKAQKAAPASATHRFGGWAKLNADLDSLIVDERADKNAEDIDAIGQPRSAQLHFLNAIRKSLATATVSEAEKVAILAGAMHLVRKQIILEYKQSYGAMFFLTNLENSVIFKGLTKVLDAEKVADQDIEALLSSTAQYMSYMTVEPKAEDKKAIRATTIFSAITGFDLKTTFNLVLDMIYSCRTSALKDVVIQFNKEKAPEKAEKAASGYLGGISALVARSIFPVKKDGADSDEDSLEIEHTGNPSNVS